MTDKPSSAKPEGMAESADDVKLLSVAIVVMLEGGADPNTMYWETARSKVEEWISKFANSQTSALRDKNRELEVRIKELEAGK